MDKRPLQELNGKVSLLRVVPFSLQQILAMFVTNLVPITVVTAAASPKIPQAALNARFVKLFSLFCKCEGLFKFRYGREASGRCHYRAHAEPPYFSPNMRSP